MHMEFDVPDITVMNDLTIYYKGPRRREGQINEEIEEISTSKEEFIRKLRYFKPKINEINQQKEIFIHDEFSIEIFKEFISTLTTKKVSLNADNYLVMKKLSEKYGYNELYQVVSSFSIDRPDIKRIVDEYSKEEKCGEIDSDKEEMISAHLDICLQNESMLNFPIESLNRILNSPKRVLNDHHLLFEFVKKIIEKSQMKNDKTDDLEEEKLQILLRSLDYSKMSNSELKVVFESREFNRFFGFSGIEETVNKLLNENESKEEIIDAFKTRIEQLESKISNSLKEEKALYENQMNEISEMKHQIETQSNIITKYEEELEKQRKFNEAQTAMMKEFEEKFLQKFKEQEKQKQKLIETQTTKIKDLEEKIKNFELSLDAKCRISVSVQRDQKIKGMICINEGLVELDLKRSKYLLNTSNSKQLGESSYDDGFVIENLNQEVSFYKGAGTYYLHVLLVRKDGKEKEFVSESFTTKETVYTYDFTGRVDTVTLDKGSYKFEVWGAEGGKHGNYSNTSGKGGYSFGTLNLQKKTKFYIHVGESPRNEKGG